MSKNTKLREKRIRKKVKKELIDDIYESNQKIFCYCCYTEIDKTNNLISFIRQKYKISYQGLQYDQCTDCNQYFHYYCGANQFINQKCLQCQSLTKQITKQCFECGLLINNNTAYSRKIEDSQQWIHVLCAFFSQKIKIVNFQKFQFKIKNKIQIELKQTEQCDHCYQMGKQLSCINQCKKGIQKAHLICYLLKLKTDHDEDIPFIFKNQFRYNELCEETKLKNPVSQIYCPDCVTQIYCICNSYSNSNSNIIFCELCNNWYHSNCLEQDSDVSHFICKFCDEYLLGLKNDKIILSNMQKNVCMREIIIVCQKVQQQIMDQKIDKEKLIQLAQQLPINFKQILKSSNIIMKKEKQLEQVEQESLKSEEKTATQTDQLEIKNKEFIQLNKSLILSNTKQFINYKHLFKSNNLNNFFNFLSYFYKQTQYQKSIELSTNQEICQQIQLEIQPFIINNLEKQELQSILSKFEIKYVNFIDNPIIKETIINIYDFYTKQYLLMINEKIKKNNKNSKVISIKNLNFLEKIINIRNSLSIQQENFNFKQFEEHKNNYKICLQESDFLLKNMKEFTKFKDFQKRLEYLTFQKRQIDQLLINFQRKGINHQSIQIQLQNWQLTFEWTFHQLDILKDMVYSNLDEYQEKIQESYQIAYDNNWNYLPLFDETTYIIEKQFNINMIANKMIASSETLFDILNEIQIQDLNENQFLLNDIFKQYNHDFSFYFMQYFYTVQINRQYSFQNLLKILIDTQKFIQQFSDYIKEIDYFKIQESEILILLQFVQKNKIIYSVEIGGLFILIWLNFLYNHDFIKNKQILIKNSQNLMNQQYYQAIKEKYSTLTQIFEQTTIILMLNQSQQKIQDLIYLYQIYYFLIEKKFTKIKQQNQFQKVIQMITENLDLQNAESFQKQQQNLHIFLQSISIKINSTGKKLAQLDIINIEYSQLFQYAKELINYFQQLIDSKINYFQSKDLDIQTLQSCKNICEMISQNETQSQYYNQFNHELKNKIGEELLKLHNCFEEP